MSLAELPTDIIRHEIASYLDPTSEAQFRTVSKDMLTLLTKAPHFSVSRWELAAQHTALDQYRRSRPYSVFPVDWTGLVRRLDQAMYDDHEGCFDLYWTTFLERMARFVERDCKESCWQHVLYVAISCGSLHAWTAVSNAVWSRFSAGFGDGWQWPRYLPLHDKHDGPFKYRDLLCYGIGFGQMGFLLKIAPYNVNTLCTLALADAPPERDRYNSQSRRSCIHMLLKGHHFADFEPLWRRFQEQLPWMGVWHRNDVHRACRTGALRHGLDALVADYATTYTYADLIEAIPNATSSAGLVMLERVRPGLFQKLHAKGKRGKYAAAVATRSGSIPVLKWLIFEKGYLPDTAKTYTRLAVCAANKGHWRTAEWAKGQLKRFDCEKSGS
jgi:hypothetical protein